MNRRKRAIHAGISLDKVVEASEDLKVAYKSDLDFGDSLIIVTGNSSYHIQVLGYDSYLISGGWFSQKGLAPMKTSIAGCTWGGRMLKTDIIAAHGLKLEFENRVITSRVRKIIVLKSSRN